MGRLVLATAGDSSPSSAESNFRELDEVFLQTQTRIWLGEVLNIRLDEDLHISNLLQDGEILFEVSIVIWNLLLTKCMELRHLKQKYGPFNSKKSSGRYRPYSNVDSFLKICKILGLSGIDLFSPSDIVEKRDIRKVCICIRALSKKVRSKQLKVPDFDMVMYSVAMPTDMVGGIRRSLESSQNTRSSSSSYSSHKSSQMKLKQKNMYALSDKDDESSSEDSDEAESRYMDENSFSLESKSDVAAGVDIEKRHIHKNGDVDICDVNLSLDNDDSIVGDSSSMNVGESNYISDYLAFSDLMVHHASDDSSSVILGGENNMFDFFLNIDSQNSKKRNFQNDEDMEVSSTTSMSSVLGRMLNLEFDDQFDANDTSTTNVNSSASMEHEEVEKQYKDFCWENCDEFVVDSNHTTPLYNEKENGTIVATMLGSDNSKDFVTSDPLSSLCKGEAVEVSEISHTGDQIKIVGNVSSGQGTTSVVSDDHIFSDEANKEKSFSAIHPCLPVSDLNKAHEEDKTVSSAPGKDSQKGTNLPEKHGRRPLLKTVVKGTAIAGVLFLLLHIRKSRGNNAQETKKDTSVPKYKGTKFSFTKQQTGSRGKGIYPAEKIKL